MIVRQTDLRVDEAGLELKNAHARFRQNLVIGPRHGVDVPLVGDARRDDAHVDAGLRGHAQSRDHLVVQDQIRRHDPEPPAGRLDEALEDRRADIFVVERAVGKGLDIALSKRLLAVIGPESLDVFFETRDIVPDAQKHHHHRPHRAAAHQNAAVLPLAEALFFVDILVGKIHPARKTGLAVDDHELAVVAVIEPPGQNRNEGIEHVRLNAHVAQLFAVVHGKIRDAAEIVVHHAHIDALRRLAPENVQDRAPHFSVVDDEKFEKNIVLGFFQLFEHPRKARLAAWKIDGVGGVVDRIAGACVQIPRMVPRRDIGLLERVHRAPVLPQMLRDHDLDARHAAVFAV